MLKEITKQEITSQDYEFIDSIQVNNKHVRVWSKADEDKMGWKYIATHFKDNGSHVLLYDKPFSLAPSHSEIALLMKESGLITNIRKPEREFVINMDFDELYELDSQSCDYYNGSFKSEVLMNRVLSEIVLDKRVANDTSIEILSLDENNEDDMGRYAVKNNIRYESPNNSATDQNRVDARIFQDAEKSILAGNINGLQEYMTHFPDIVKKSWPNGRTLLHAAAWVGDATKIESLLKAGAVVDAKDQWGNTPLMFTAIQGHDAAMMSLVQRGANTQATNHKGNDIKSLAKLHMTEEELPVLKIIQAKDMAMDIIAEMGMSFQESVKPN